MKTYWISFVGDSGNLGCCMVDAAGEKQALDKTRQLGINPGGEAMLFEIPKDCIDMANFDKDVLIPPGQLRSHGYKKIGDLSVRQLYRLSKDPKISQVCEICNTKKP